MEESVEKNEQVIIEGTISCKKFFEALHKDLGFFDFILTVVANMDYACQQRFKIPQFQRNEIPHYERLIR
jgi:hypothetical protein